MRTSINLPALSLALALSLVSAAPTTAVAGGIDDGGAFFSADAKSQAGKVISDLESQMKKEVVVETFKEIPPDIKVRANLQTTESANQFFDRWATKQALEYKVNGVYILLVRDPAHIQVVVGNETQKKAFTLQDRDALLGTMLPILKQKNFDKALVEGVSFISRTMRSHVGAGVALPADRGTGGTVAQPSEVDAKSGGGMGSWIWTILFIVAAIWLVRKVFGALFGARGNGGAGVNNPGGPMNGGGGGFLSSALSGMFGAAAGMWMYNSFFGGQAQGSEGGDHAAGSDSGAAGSSDAGGGFSGQDTDYSSSGDSFGGDSGGGDWGGGGDSGGGDFGGGGDF